MSLESRQPHDKEQFRRDGVFGQIDGETADVVLTDSRTSNIVHLASQSRHQTHVGWQHHIDRDEVVEVGIRSSDRGVSCQDVRKAGIRPLHRPDIHLDVRVLDVKQPARYQSSQTENEQLQLADFLLCTQWLDQSRQCCSRWRNHLDRHADSCQLSFVGCVEHVPFWIRDLGHFGFLSSAFLDRDQNSTQQFVSGLGKALVSVKHRHNQRKQDSVDRVAVEQDSLRPVRIDAASDDFADSLCSEVVDDSLRITQPVIIA